MELLAPAGNFASFMAGIANGADAVYLGGKDFNARQGAENFTEEEIKEAVYYAHVRGRKVYITINTLLANDELERALDYLFRLYRLGIDAVIVQDLGFMQAVRRVLPDLRIHASTQMTVHNEQGALFIYNEGVKRVVLAREMSLDEIKKIKNAVPDLELEVFAHGALCYSYSGQCLFSSMVGGRSGNRGRCAQPCRLRYRLYKDKENKPLALEKGQYILSPADIALIDFLPELKKAGVNSLKIEGRMKRPEYVAVVTRNYRRMLDVLEEKGDYTVDEETKKELLKIFNRHLSRGYLWGVKDDILSPMRPNNRGVNVGRVVSQDKDFNTEIKLSDEVQLGDGLEIWVNKGKNPAFIVKEMRKNGKKVAVAGKGDVITVKIEGRVAKGDRVFKTHDEKLISSAVASIKNSSFKVGVKARVYLEAGRPLVLEFIDDNGNIARAESALPLEKAEKQGLDAATLREKIGRLGNTPFYLQDLVLIGEENTLIIPFSEINATRRRVCEELYKIYSYSYDRIEEEEYIISKKSYLEKREKVRKSGKRIPRLCITVSGIEEAVAARKAGADRVYIALEKLIKPRAPFDVHAVNRSLVDLNLEYGGIIPCLPRIQKPGEFRPEILEGVEEVLTGNLGSMKWCLDKGIRTRADYTLNVFNQYALEYLLDKGVKGVALSPELSFKELASFTDLSRAELLVHGELILMVSEYCPFPYLLEGERDKCPRFCQRGEYYIKDEKGYEFPVTTDAFCRYYVFNSRTLCLIDDLPKITKLGVEGVRIEGRRLKPEEVSATVRIYRQALDIIAEEESFDSAQYREKLRRVSRSDFTKCHYYRGVM
ncbi:putative protease [Thermosyntropha lipolytica DSM 11003]|uniref:Putative protease n=1 Tax=Thermosyntropha lipolytica DSM 11003 TaxID=1123382 RepID=A0A1M5K774_9FIRM|nr:U32 family peptidase [Thermosyntropha lipolytica]SHG48637.1 putative protease [Thermosyntropha lipolytica DSM 11003]